MLTYISGKNRTRREEVSPKVQEVKAQYERIAEQAVFRAYPSIPDFGVEICLLDGGDMLELFWSIFNLGGDAPGGWHQVTDLTLSFRRRGDGRPVSLVLSAHVAGFHAWYRMRGGMVSVLPNSQYLNLEAGTWEVSVSGKLQDAQPLCLFADAFGDLFHDHYIRDHYREVRDKLCEAHIAATADPAPIESFCIPCGELVLAEGRNAPILGKQANRLHQTAVSYEDVKGTEEPALPPPRATELDPVSYFRDKLYYLQQQSVEYNYCPYDTVNHWDHEPQFERAHYQVSDRTAYFHIEALAPLYRATGDEAVYCTTRKWYETIVRNIWPMPGGGTALACGDRTVYGSALHNGGVSDAMCTFTEIDGDPRWLEPVRAALRAWPMHPTLPRPLMDQDAWGNEEMNTTGTYNMCTHFALGNWRVGYLTGDAVLMARAERILNEYTFPGEQDGVWSYRPGDFPSHHYDMYLKWQLSRLLLTGAERWTGDAEFLARLRRGMDASLERYTKVDNGELTFWDWTHNPEVTHPANAARHGTQQLEALLALAIYVDAGYREPMERVLRGLYRLLLLPEVDRCWHGAWFHVHGNLLSLALHGFHVEGNAPSELRVVRE